MDDDPEGEKLLQQDFMEQSSKIVRNMVMYSSLDTASHARRVGLEAPVVGDALRSLQPTEQGAALPPGAICMGEDRVRQALRQLWEVGGRNRLYYKLVAPPHGFPPWSLWPFPRSS